MAVLASPPVAAIELRVPGKPTGKGRPRFDTRTGRTYTPGRTENAEALIRAVWRDAGEPRMPDDQALGIEVTLTVVRPAAHWRKDGTLTAEGLRHPIPRTQKPDLDNAVKLVMDSLNGLAYHDDVRVSRLLVWRTWGSWPETQIRIYPLQAAEELA